MRLSLISTLLICCSLLAFGQEDDYFEDNFFRHSDFIYKDNIKTVELEVVNVNVSLPIIMLGSTEQLQLDFDDLDGGFKNYSYTVIHCDRDWNPSDIPYNDYVDGYNEDQIYNDDYSFNTNQNYTHYSLRIPRETMRLKISGNYVLYVFEDSDRENPVLTRRFRVYEQQVRIINTIRPPIVSEERRTSHSCRLEVDYQGYEIKNPLRDVSLYVYQNQRWDNAYEDLKPIFLQENRLIYDNMDEVVFRAGNEFRWLDFRSFRYWTENIEKMWQDRDSSMWHVFVLPEEQRRTKRYSTFQDIDGRFDISVQEGNDDRVEADYAMVHFTLKSDSMITGSSVYLYGGLTDWRYQPRFRMDYNKKRRAYELSGYFKQGYYNYQYMVVPDKQDMRTRDKGGIGETWQFEGDFFQTEQIYLAFLYHRGMGMNYDRIIGFSKESTVRID